MKIRSTDTPRDEGFSLAEVVLIVAVLFVVTGISIPLVSNSVRGLQLSSDARQIASALSYAKMAATSKMTRYQLTFNVGGNHWHLQRYNRSTGNFEAEGASSHLSQGLSGSGIALHSTSSSAPSGFPTTSSSFIRFNSRGVPVNSAGVPTGNNVIYLSGGGTKFAVTVSLVGKVQLWKHQDSQWVTQ